jgi:hypothetical protein
VAPSPAPAPTPTPTPEPVDDLALPPAFSADSAGGLVDPILSGSAEPGASVAVTAVDGSAWSTTADPSGAWTLVADGLPAGVSQLAASQTDVAGNVSVPGPPVTVELASPILELRRSGTHVVHGTFTGVPGAAVQLLIDGTTVGTATLDGSGSAGLLGVGWVDDGSVVEVRYAVDGRTGPVSIAVVERT